MFIVGLHEVDEGLQRVQIPRAAAVGLANVPESADRRQDGTRGAIKMFYDLRRRSVNPRTSYCCLSNEDVEKHIVADSLKPGYDGVDICCATTDKLFDTSLISML